MKSKIYLLLLLIVSCGSPEQHIEDDYYEPGGCIYKKSTKQKTSMYPFNEVDKIEVLSYPARNFPETNIPASLKYKLNDSLVIDKGFILKGIADKLTLNQAQTDTLFTILYDYTTLDSTMMTNVCYAPRHSILFYKQAKIIAYIEICFECHNTYISRDIDFGVFCNEKTDLIRGFLKRIGIKHYLYGTY